MVNDNASFPYPVLGHNDDVGSLWSVGDFTYTPLVEDVEIHFRYRSDDQDLIRLLRENKAAVVARWECTSTISTGYIDFYDRTRHADGFSLKGSIDQRKLRDKATIHVFAIAAQDLPSFRWANQHSDYGDQRFDIHAGDILTVDTVFPIVPAKLYDPANPPLNSCFRFVADPERQKGIRIDYGDDEVIIVSVPKRTLQTLNLMSDRPELQMSLLALPSLMDAISLIQHNATDTEVTSAQWFNTIKDLLEQYKVMDERPFEAAQALLRYPIEAYASKEDDFEGEE